MTRQVNDQQSMIISIIFSCFMVHRHDDVNASFENGRINSNQSLIIIKLRVIQQARIRFFLLFYDVCRSRAEAAAATWLSTRTVTYAIAITKIHSEISPVVRYLACNNQSTSVDYISINWCTRLVGPRNTLSSRYSGINKRQNRRQYTHTQMTFSLYQNWIMM